MKQIKTALFVDFDNIFGGLHEYDPDMAIAMANKPSRWLERLKKHSLPEGVERDFLVRRVYLNPNGKLPDTIRSDTGSLLFLNFRQHLTNAGFEVVDCPSLTKQGKNASDIRIVVDVFEGLNATTRYDEYIIVSSDSDFSPLFQSLRSKDRRVTMVFGGPTASAYRNIANFHLNMMAIIDEKEVKKLRDVAKGNVWNEAKRYIDNSNAPLLLKSLRTELQKKFGEDTIDKVDKARWFGEGSFSEFVRLMGGKDGIHVHGEDVRKADKHDEPKKAVIDEEAKEARDNADKHDEPKKTVIDEEKAKEVWDVTKGYIDNSNDPHSLKYLGSRIKSEFYLTIEKTNWFGEGSFSGFVRLMGGKDGIHVHGEYVRKADKHDELEKAFIDEEAKEVWGNADKHDEPEKAFLDEEEAKKCWDVAKDYIDNNNEPVLLSNLANILRSEFGKTIDKSNWFREGSLSRFVHFRGAECILMNEQYVWNADKHDEPKKVVIDEEEVKEVWGMAKGYIDYSKEAVSLANLVSILRSEFAETIAKSNWFGKGSISKFVRSMGDEHGIRMNDLYIWNANLHDEPVDLKEKYKEQAKEVSQWIKDYIGNSDEAVLLSNLTSDIRSKFGQEKVTESSWFGMGSINALVHRMMAKDGIRIRDGRIWDVNKHAEPETVDIPTFVEQCCQLVDFPRLTSKEWEAAIKKFAEYTDKHDEFDFPESVKWMRASLDEDGFQIGRNALKYIISSTGNLSNPDHQLNADDIRESLLKRITDHPQILSLDLSDDNIASLDAWLSGKETP